MSTAEIAENKNWRKKNLPNGKNAEEKITEKKIAER